MSFQSCIKCGKPIPASMLRDGRARKIGAGFVCPACRIERASASTPQRLPSTQAELPAAHGSKGVPTRRSSKNLPLPSENGTHREADRVDFQLGDQLASASGRARGRLSSTTAKSLSKVKRSAKEYANSETERTVRGEQHITKYIVIGSLLLLAGIAGVMVLNATSKPSQEDRERQRARLEDRERQEANEEKEREAAKDAPLVVKIEDDPERVPQSEPDELGVFLPGDDMLDEVQRRERDAWSRKRGQPAPGEGPFVLGDFESDEELRMWRFAPQKDVLAWLGKKGIATGKIALRLQVPPCGETPGEASFYLATAADEAWDWRGANAVIAEAFNPQRRALKVALEVGSGEGKKLRWDFEVPPGKSFELRGELQGADFEPLKVQRVGLKVPRDAKKELVIYLDNFHLEGSFK
ncbi:MAG: hypothetical protein L6R28_16780 [Planctomycetes bacterium]|nr:hypothetical protein [Planctomycetota bacterium]